MPFTFAHPALVIPLKNSKWFSFSALLAGSLVPDFEYFFQMREVENIGHSWLGIFIFDLPVALIMCYLFHHLLRDGLWRHLPSALAGRIDAIPAFNWNRYVIENKFKVFYSLMIGVLSHILWDGFTHDDGIFVSIFPLLQQQVSCSSVFLPVYFLLQIVFSFIGLLIVVIALIKLPKTDMKQTTVVRQQFYWPFFTVLFLFILGVRLIVWPQHNSFWGVFMAVMGAGIYSIISVSIISKFSFK